MISRACGALSITPPIRSAAANKGRSPVREVSDANRGSGSSLLVTRPAGAAIPWAILPRDPRPRQFRDFITRPTLSKIAPIWLSLTISGGEIAMVSPAIRMTTFSSANALHMASKPR